MDIIHQPLKLVLLYPGSVWLADGPKLAWGWGRDESRGMGAEDAQLQEISWPSLADFELRTWQNTHTRTSGAHPRDESGAERCMGYTLVSVVFPISVNLQLKGVRDGRNRKG